MKDLSGLKIAICQMPVKPGLPMLNGQYIISEIIKAEEKGIDIIVFPELATTGYFLGDLWEDNFFIDDVQIVNQQIIAATRDKNVIVVFGSIRALKTERGEDGRLMKRNSAFLVRNGKLLAEKAKTLQPNYRIFDDNRHFYSNRQLAEKEDQSIGFYHEPLKIKTSVGNIQLGIILCEDMWHQDYHYNPSQYLVENGAELIINLSASPWSWQKNRKRHQVVEELLEQSPVTFVYVNNAGTQNTGKNIIVFDGSSAVYNAQGQLINETEPYFQGTDYFEFKDDNAVLDPRHEKDTQQLYLALKEAVRGMFNSLPPHMRKVVIGLSGGIDSAVAAALYADILGPENVYAYNLPTVYNSQTTRDLAKHLAENLGVNFEEIKIDEVVAAITAATNIDLGTLVHENIQARARMEILAAKAQQIGGVFSSNYNKVEAALGYGTLYGDMAGFIAVLGDLIKREVYQLADYLNKEVYNREVIPQGVFNIKPTAELSPEHNVEQGKGDPFDYGNLEKRGYHDELVRAFVVFRQNPEFILAMYLHNKLEELWRLEPGTLNRLFPTAREFIKDLEKNWRRFYGSYFKRVQSAPIPIVSKRAFGTDLRESIIPANLTQKYFDLKAIALARNKKTKRIAIYGGSFNPPGMHHQFIIESLSKHFDKVIIVPCGLRTDKPSANIVLTADRMEMVRLAFSDIPNTELDLFDLENNDEFTPTYLLQQRYEQLYPDAQIWHVVGGDIIEGGREQNSEIHRTWHYGKEIWHDLNFAVIVRPGYQVEKTDMPSSSELISIPDIIGSGTLVRQLIAKKESISKFVNSAVMAYIEEKKLYLSK